jgi:hypothetical protein
MTLECLAVKLRTFMLQTSCSRAHSSIGPPPIWEMANGSRDPVFRGVSCSSLSINNLLCGPEDLYFPLKCGFFRCYGLCHLSFGQMLRNKKQWADIAEVVFDEQTGLFMSLHATLSRRKERGTYGKKLYVMQFRCLILCTSNNNCDAGSSV